MTDSKPQPRPKSKVKPRSKRERVGPALTGLAGAAGLLTAIVGLISALPSISTWAKKQLSSRPYQVIEPVSYPEVVPSYLREYYEDEDVGGQEKLYWLRSNMTNKTEGELALVITFYLDRVHCKFVIIDQSQNSKPFDVKAGKMIPTNFTPPLKFLNDKATDDCVLKVHYKITDEAGDEPYEHDAKITLLPPQKVSWDLMNVDRQPVSLDFLLASLTAWSLSTEGKVPERGNDLRRRAPESSTDWLRLCYEILFEGKSASEVNKKYGPVIIDPTGNTYPFERVTTLRHPDEIISAGRADPLEAAFLMASVINAATTPGQVPMTLFVLPQAQDIHHPAVLLGTPLPNSESWEIIDLRKANSLAFRQNLEQSQQELRQALSQNPQMLRSLQDKGVFTSVEVSSPKAISFNRARIAYRTLGLP